MALARLRPLRGLRAIRRAYSTHRLEVPVIDLAGSDAAVASEVASACEEWGFFQVVNHGVDAGVTARWEAQMRAFFALPTAEKAAIRRHAGNARGFFDDELTKQKRDWKEALDFGVTPSRDWSLADGDAANANLDGFNQFPPASRLPAFRPAMHAYFDACTSLAERLTEIFALGLGLPRDHFTEGERLREAHTSYLRMNYYPTCAEPGEPPPLGISPHKDAGFLTVLKQDDDCHSLQVRRRGAPDDEWSTVHPVPGALTVNTGDMAQASPPARPRPRAAVATSRPPSAAQVWSNDRYHAPEHRVLTSPDKVRYSAPYFYNPGYATTVAPSPTHGAPRYAPVVWGYFRAQRFAGDFADFGTEIQISDFAASDSWHVANQARFVDEVDFEKPFSLEENRRLLSREA